MAVHLLGIRHHGPGSARSVLQYLKNLRPDIILIEGPPEADSLIQWAGDPLLQPPVAMLCFRPDKPSVASFYPFASFSPEWQALQYAMSNTIPVKFMDLPLSHRYAIREAEEKEWLEKMGENTLTEKSENEESNADANEPELTPEEKEEPVDIRQDPLTWLAEAGGYSDAEACWEQLFEHRLNSDSVFEAVEEAMTTLREQMEPEKEKDLMEERREAWMRKLIREAEREMYTEIAVVCGAWHVPALRTMPTQKADNDLLKGMPKTKVESSWVPWTFDRLSSRSGYGAGIESPGWYDHVWKYPTDDGSRWMSNVARIFREEQKDVSVAHVIDCVRLSESLASMRGMHKAGLREFNESTVSIMCAGDEFLFNLVDQKLIIGNRLGQVPDTIPKPPLLVDIEKEQKRCRLAVSADSKEYSLDLRKDLDLSRSELLHRLNVLDISWGRMLSSSGKGTFRESWTLQWQPELSISIVEKGRYGNSLEAAATNWLLEKSATSSLEVLGTLLTRTLPASLPAATEKLIGEIEDRAAATADVLQLMIVVPELTNIIRYGNVRKTDAGLVQAIVHSMITRICISLPSATTGIEPAVAATMIPLFRKIHESVNLLEVGDLKANWQQSIRQVANNKQSARLLAGYAGRLLVDYRLLQGAELEQHFYAAMSASVAPNDAAEWLEGFLEGSGTVLLFEEGLWALLNEWISALDAELFIELLPLLRRTFAKFNPVEKKKLAEKLHSGSSARRQQSNSIFNEENAIAGLPVILQLFGHNETGKKNE